MGVVRVEPAFPRFLGHPVSVPAVLVFGGISLATLLLGGAATRLDSWYFDLAKPAWTPPGAVIGPVWWGIFALLALAMSLVWAATPRDGGTALVYAALGVNLVLNVAWSWIFFTLQLPALALAEIMVLWTSILALALAARRKSRLAAWLLLPYLAWTTFAAALNAAIVALN